MSDDKQAVSEMIRDGSYFDASRAWYQVLYIGPIAERSFFLIIAGLAVAVALVATVALTSLLPITERPGLILKTDRMDSTIANLTGLAPAGANVNPAMLQFFVSAYVMGREGYSAAFFASNSAFVAAHSDEATMNDYVAVYGSQNPQSPAAILGARGSRIVEIQSIAINDTVEPNTATVQFTTELKGTETTSKTRWTATLQYLYSDLTVEPVIDPETGKENITTQDPQFQVVNYVLSQTP